MGFWSRLKDYLNPSQPPPAVQPPGPAVIQYNVLEEKGVPFPSVLDFENQQQFSGNGSLPRRDWWIRQSTFKEVEQLFATELVLNEACNKLCRGAVGNKGPQIIVKPVDTSREAQLEAALADSTVKQILRLMDPITLEEWSYQLGKFCNLPIYIPNDGPTITEIKALAPMGFDAKVNLQNSFEPGQQDCYIQYDVLTQRPVPDAMFSLEEMVWVKYNCAPWEVFGHPLCFTVRNDTRALIEGAKILPDARQAAIPEKTYLTGKDGMPHDVGQLKDFKAELPEELFKRGIKANPRAARILNGANDVKVLSPGTEFFTNLKDLTFHAERICAPFHVALALVVAPSSGATTALLAQLTEDLYEAQSYWASVLEHRMIRPILEIAFKRGGINSELIQMDIIWSKRKLPSRLLQEIFVAKTGWMDGVVCIDSYAAITANYLELNSGSELAQVANDRKAGIVPPSTSAPLNDPVLQGDILDRKPQLGLQQSDRIKAGINGKKAANDQRMQDYGRK